MDDQRFDALVRGLAQAGSRRQVLRGLLGLGVIAAVPAVQSAGAARRPEPTPKPVKCPGQQILVSGACVCPAGKAKCGPDCCPAGAECCDNACCYGTCYGEELCCPTGSIVCNGRCHAWECCDDGDCAANSICDPDTHTCQCLPDCTGKKCGDDGCGGSCGTCPSGQVCSNGRCAVCPAGTMLCADGECHQCCFGFLDCQLTQGGTWQCWECREQSCKVREGLDCDEGSGFCSHLYPGQCIECGDQGEMCDAGNPCCFGLSCNMASVTWGYCQSA